MIAIVLYLEKKPLSSVGFGPLTLDVVLHPISAAAVYILLIAPVANWVSDRVFPRENVIYPRTLTVSFVLATFVSTIGIEIIMRGYMMERVSSLTDSFWIAGLCSALASAVLYLSYGRGEALYVLIYGTFLVVCYSLMENIIFNIILVTLICAYSFIYYRPDSVEAEDSPQKQ